MPTTTTYSAIRDNYIAVLEALTPTRLTNHRFRRSPRDMRIRQWAPQVGSGAMRHFEFIRGDLVADPIVMDPSAVERDEDMILTVAYPAKFALYGRNDIDDMETVMRTDAQIIRDLMFSSSSYLPGHSAGFPQLELTDRADQRCWFNVFRISLIYTETQSLS